MGRDEAVADRLIQNHKLHVIGQWENPGLMDKAKASGGQFQVVDSITNIERIADLVEHIQPDMFVTNFDDALAAGVVDLLKRREESGRLKQLHIPCPDRAASRIEWDKFYLRELIEEIDSSYNPKNFMVTTKKDVELAIEHFENQNMPIAVKPRGLTGGKGVKVMGKHFETFEEGRVYALSCIARSEQAGVEIQEKIEGREFTLQLFTDGKTIIEPPATYDYPYREDGDLGPGTGGMGAFSMEHGLLPFVSQDIYDEAIELMKKLLGVMNKRSLNYKGVLYPTFFKTIGGLKIVETNARGGDPELINIVDLLDDDIDLGQVLKSIATGELAVSDVQYKRCGSAMLYLVSPDYGYGKGPSYTFTMNADAIESLGCSIRFAATERIKGDEYRTVGSSRSVGLSALGQTAWEARDKIHQAIKSGFGQPLELDYRLDVAEEAYIKNLTENFTL